MARAYKCDACGNYYDKRDLRISNDRYTTVGRVNLYDQNGYIFDNYDLCDDCLKKVLDILGIETERIEEDDKE